MPSTLLSGSWLLTAGVVLAALLSVSAYATALGFAAERLLPRRRIFAVPLFDGQYRFEALGNAVFLAVATAAVTAGLRGGALRFGESSPARNVATFVGMTWGFQVFYWFLHRAMHHRALVRIHRWHHRSQVTTPLTGQSMSAAEAALWMLGYVALPALASRVTPLGFWGWAGYLGFNVFGNVFGHANVECVIPAGATRAASLFSNAFVFHALHHARWTGHYGFQGAGMDRLMGTEWSDWPALYASVDRGRPITSLKQRGEPDASTTGA